MADTGILVIGAFGQLGTELIPELARKYGAENIVAADIHVRPSSFATEELDIVDKKKLIEIIKKYGVKQIYHLAAILSATGEQQPQVAWEVNMQGLVNVLDASVTNEIEKLFWPSSIAVFGPSTPKEHTPQTCVMDPSSIYGITKLAGERLCEYYHYRYGLDVRSLRYPGLIGHSGAPGGGTTDYAIHIFYAALKHKRYTCFLAPDARLPMMYMPDALRATLEVMEAPADNITIHSSYNLHAVGFSPAELTEAIQKHIPDFVCTYEPDFRQTIAASWPGTIDDSVAQRDWGWKPEYDLDAFCADMLEKIAARLETEKVG